MIRDIASGSESAFTMLLRQPRWSPDGSNRRYRCQIGVEEMQLCPRRHVVDNDRPLHWFKRHVFILSASRRFEWRRDGLLTFEGKDEVKVADLHPLHPIGRSSRFSVGRIVWLEYQQEEMNSGSAQLP
jgi:hypothetical protein